MDEIRHVSHWGLVMRLLHADIPYEVIQELHEGEIAVILAILRAKDRKAEEDAQANANRR